MLSHKGTLFCKQHLSKKKTKWGIKNWLLCCAQTSYVFDFDVLRCGETKSSNKTAKKVSTKAGKKNSKTDNQQIFIILEEVICFYYYGFCDDDFVKKTSGHFPERTKDEAQLTCKHCHKGTTTYQCDNCKKPLHILCFRQFHSS